MLHAPVSHISFRLRLVFLRPAVTPRCSSIVCKCSVWRQGLCRMATHNDEPPHSYSPHKSKLSRNRFSWLTDPVVGHVLFCFPLLGVWVGLHITHITIERLVNQMAHVCSPKTACRRLKCRVCLSLGSGKCDHMAVSSRPPALTQRFYPTADGRLSLRSLFLWLKTKRWILNMSRSLRLTLVSGTVRRHLADWHRRSKAPVGLHDIREWDKMQ